MQLYKRLIKGNNSSTIAKHKTPDKDNTLREDIEENNDDSCEEIDETENFTLTQQKKHENFTFTECTQDSHVCKAIELLSLK